MTPEEIAKRGIVILDEKHPDGGLGLQVIGLPDGAIAVKARVENLELVAGKGEAFFVVGPQVTGRLAHSLGFWKSKAEEVRVPTPEPAPTDE